MIAWISRQQTDVWYTVAHELEGIRLLLWAAAAATGAAFFLSRLLSFGVKMHIEKSSE